MREYTVVIPVYNVASYLPRCIESVLAQTIKAQKIILVDDGSTDNSGTICDEYAERNETIQVIHQSNQGLSAARNTGIDVADTPWITFVDSDDYIDPDMYETLFQNLETYNADISICGVWVEKENGEKSTFRATGVLKEWDTTGALRALNSYQYFNMSVWNVMFRCSLFDAIPILRFPIGKKCEDYYLMHQIIARAHKIVYDSTPHYHYIQRPNSISRNKNINLAPMDASLAQLNFFEQNYPDIAFAAKTACAFSHMGIYTAYVRSGQQCPPEMLQHLKKIARKYLPSVLKNPDIPKIKKLQALSFCWTLPIYRTVIARTEHR